MSIHFWQGLQQGSPVLDSFKKIVHEWNETHADCRVVVKDFTDYGAPAKEALSNSPEEQPSLVLAPEFMTGSLMTALGSKKVIPITQLLDRACLEKIASIVRLTFGDKDGRLVSLPFNPSCGVIFTNKTLMKEVGRGPDYVPETIEELEAVCKQLIEKGLVESGYTCAWPAAYLVEVPAAQQDIPLVVPENGKLGFGKYQLSQDWLKRHLLDLRRQQKDRVFFYAGRDNNSRKPFVDRKVAFFMQGSTHMPVLQKEARDFEVGCGPLPTLVQGQKEKYAFPLGGAAIWVMDNPNTQKMISGVRDFLNYLASDEIQIRWHQETAYVPVLETIPKLLEEFHKKNPLHKAVVKQTIETCLGKYSFGIQAPNYADARKELFDLIEKVLDVNTKDEQVEIMLKAFDEKFSLPQNS